MVASAFSSAPVSAITVPIPKVWWRTRSPTSNFKFAFWELEVIRFPVGATVGFGFDFFLLDMQYLKKFLLFQPLV